MKLRIAHLCVALKHKKYRLSEQKKYIWKISDAISMSYSEKVSACKTKVALNDTISVMDKTGGELNY